jgi:uncharacterized protein (DUF697 family)
MTAGAELFTLVRKGVAATNLGAEARKPFRFLLCGDPALVAEFRGLLLSGHAEGVPFDAPATLETIDPAHAAPALGPDARCAIFLARSGDLAGARLDLLQTLGLPIFVVIVDAAILESHPSAVPGPGEIAEYIVPRIDRESLHRRLFPHLIDQCKGIEVAVGRRLPPLREAVANKLTRNAATSALWVAGASALADHLPVIGLFVGAVASAGDMVAITGIQIVLMVQIGAAYGKDPDVQRIWELLPVVGGGFGWRALSRELAGFVPVAGVAIKAAIAYAGTIVVGEGSAFYYEHGRHMTAAQAAELYDEKKRSAMTFARDLFTRFKKK